MIICRAPANDDITMQPIELFIQTKFISPDNEKLKEYTPPPPPGLLTVPYDIFYPFIGNTATNSQNIKFSFICILSILVSIVFYIFI